MRGKRPGSFEIALSGISCGIAVLFLSLGIMTGVGPLTSLGYLVGILALMLPLAKQFYRGGFLAYIGTCILAFVLGAAANFWDLIPFIMFFGLHPLANALQIKYKINKWLAFAVKAVWFDCTLLAGYFIVFGGVLGGSVLPAEVYDAINRYIYLFVFILRTLICLVYDYLIFKCQIMVNGLVSRIKK